MSRSAEIKCQCKKEKCQCVKETFYHLRSNVDFVLLVFLVFLVASDQEGVGSGLLEQVELHLAGETKSTPQCISLLGVKLAAIDSLN